MLLLKVRTLHGEVLKNRSHTEPASIGPEMQANHCPCTGIVSMLKTERTIISRIELSDAPFFARLLNTAEWRRFIGIRKIETRADAEQYLRDGFLKSYEEHGFGYYMIREVEDRAPIGIAGFLKKPALENPDFGFALLPEYAGRGLAFESSRAVLDFGITTFDFEMLDAVTVTDNHRSIRLLEQLSFQFKRTIESLDESGSLLLYRWRKEDDA